MDYLNMNIYSSSLMSDKLLSPLDKKSSRYYHYLLDSIAGPPIASGIKYFIIPKFRGTHSWSVDICGLVIRYGLFVNFILKAFMM